MWEEAVQSGLIKRVYDDTSAPEWKWRVNSADAPRGREPAIFDTLDEALADLKEKREGGEDAWLVDDRGYQIL